MVYKSTHTEECIRFGFSDDCPACRAIEEKIAKKEEKYRERYRRAIPGRNF